MVSVQPNLRCYDAVFLKLTLMMFPTEDSTDREFQKSVDAEVGKLIRYTQKQFFCVSIGEIDASPDESRSDCPLA